ncbi:MAG: site-specific integrase [Trichodesmium sp. MO_231.B1]|nr:site-specific integrase [Trichodesmium sp. MO_231.B1]
MEKKYRGKVGVSENKGRLRITIPKSVSGKAGDYLYLGLSADKDKNWKIAQAKASLLESDIFYERVDETYDRYRVLKEVVAAEKKVTFLELFQEYAADRKKTVRPTSYKSKQSVALSFLRQCPVVGGIYIDVDVEKFEIDQVIQSLKNWPSKNTALVIFYQFHAFIEWAIKLKKIKNLRVNPFDGLNSEVKPDKRRKNDDYKTLALKANERDNILNAIANHEEPFVRNYYSYYAFLFFTGCRPSEAIALTWDDIVSDYEFIKFSRAVTNSEDGLCELNGLKTQNSRLFPINNQVKNILINQRKYQPDNPGNRIFASQRGRFIDTGAVRKKVWKPILLSLNIDYKRPYTARHTFITLSLESGMAVKDIAKLVGNTAAIIYKHYASTDIRQIQVPDL